MTGLSRMAPSTKYRTPSRYSTRTPLPFPNPALTKSRTRPPMITAIVVDDAVTTFDKPMYRPEEARGMMSVISAQSTARNVPCDAPKSAAPMTASGTLGAIAISNTPRPPMAVQP
jgi:hypothetical protein